MLMFDAIYSSQVACCNSYNDWSSWSGVYWWGCTCLTALHPAVVSVRYMLTLCLRFNGHFPGEPGLAGVYWSKGWWRWWWQLHYKSCKTPVKLSPPTNQHPVFTGRMPFLSPNQQCQSTEGKNITLPQARLGVFQLSLWPLIAPGYLGEGCYASHQPSACNCWLNITIRHCWAYFVLVRQNAFIFV